MKATGIDRQKQAGLPHEPLIAPRRLFDSASASVVFTFNLTRGRVAVPQVYVRRLDEQQYTSVAAIFSEAQGLATEALTAESPVVGAGGRLYCLLSRYGAMHGGDHAAITSVGLGVMDLSTRAIQFWERAPEFFATELIGTTSDGAKVFAVVGIEKPTTEGKRVTYAIGELDIAERSMLAIAELANPFY